MDQWTACVRHGARPASFPLDATMKKRTWLGLTIGAAAVFGFGIHVGMVRGVPFVGWEEGWFVSVYTGPTPFDLHPAPGAKHPVLAPSDVTDCDAVFVADPFMVKHGDTWHMFVEVMDDEEHQGDIGLATSPDGFDWQWHSIVLDEPYHLSYPQVFQHEGVWFMLPETQWVNAVKLYKADPFPTKWVEAADLLEGAYFDCTLLQWEGRWYMMTGEKFSIARLGIADELFGPWREHPASPIYFNDDHHFRCGGRMIVYNGKPYRFNQDVHGRYGNQVRAMEITRLSPTEYEERPLGAEPLLIGTGKEVGWNSDLMHHLDPHQLPDGSWIAVVDGFGRRLVFGLDY